MIECITDMNLVNVNIVSGGNPAGERLLLNLEVDGDGLNSYGGMYL